MILPTQEEFRSAAYRAKKKGIPVAPRRLEDLDFSLLNTDSRNMENYILSHDPESNIVLYDLLRIWRKNIADFKSDWMNYEAFCRTVQATWCHLNSVQTLFIYIVYIMVKVRMIVYKISVVEFLAKIWLLVVG